MSTEIANREQVVNKRQQLQSVLDAAKKQEANKLYDQAQESYYQIINDTCMLCIN